MCNYFNSVIFKFIFLLNLLFVFWFGVVYAGQRPLLNELLADMKCYKTTSMHRGDLYEHSMWAEQYISIWATAKDGIDANSCWLNGFSDRQKYVVAVAALLHDIGKAGDPKNDEMEKNGDYLYYFSKNNHERIGFDYILHDIKDSKKYVGYKKVDGQSLNLKSILDELNLNSDEQKMVAVLVGMHKLFGLVLINKTTVKKIVKKFKKLSAKASLSADKILLRMAVAVSMADALSTYFPVAKESKSLVFDEFIKCESPHPFKEDEARAKKIISCACSEMPKIQTNIFNEFENN